MRQHMIAKYKVSRLLGVHPEGLDFAVEGLGTPQPACGHGLIEVPPYVLPSILGQVRLVVAHLIESAARARHGSHTSSCAACLLDS